MWFSLSPQSSSKNHLELIHSGTWELSGTLLGGYFYFVSFIDDHYRKIWVYFLKRKSDLFETYKKFKTLVKNEKCLKIKCLFFDNRERVLLEGI